MVVSSLFQRARIVGRGCILSVCILHHVFIVSNWWGIIFFPFISRRYSNPRYWFTSITLYIICVNSISCINCTGRDGARKNGQGKAEKNEILRSHFGSSYDLVKVDEEGKVAEEKKVNEEGKSLLI